MFKQKAQHRRAAFLLPTGPATPELATSGNTLILVLLIRAIDIFASRESRKFKQPDIPATANRPPSPGVAGASPPRSSVSSVGSGTVGEKRRNP